MVATKQAVYLRLPEHVQRSAKRWYYTFHPSLSWPLRQKMDTVDSQFVDLFFDDVDEYESYRREFFEGRIVDLCRSAAERAPADVTIYDAHVTTCVKLYSLIRKRNPETLVETGVYNGVSTLSMLLALDRNGRGTLYSVDSSKRLTESYREGKLTSNDELFNIRGRPSCAEAGSIILPPGEDPGWIIPEDLRDSWNLTTERDRWALPEILSDLHEIDLFLHDSEYSMSRMLAEFELAWAYLAEDGLILSNHVDQNDAFETFVAEHECESGLFDYLYDLNHPDEDYTEPCSSGYIIKG